VRPAIIKKKRAESYNDRCLIKSLNGLAPVYLHGLFSERRTDYDLRDSFRKLNLPKPRTDYLKRNFGYSGALLWNSLRQCGGGGGGGVIKVIPSFCIAHPYCARYSRN